MKRLVALTVVLSLALPAFGAKVKRLDDGPEPIVVRPVEPVVTIDVKDAEAVEILKSMKKQCGIKNLMIDPDVKGKGTFYLYEVPCRQAWGVVLRSLGLDATVYTNSVARVAMDKR